MKETKVYRDYFEGFFEAYDFDSEDNRNHNPDILENLVLSEFNISEFIELFSNRFEDFIKTFKSSEVISRESWKGVAYFVLRRIAENILNNSYASEFPYYSKEKSTLTDEIFFLNCDFEPGVDLDTFDSEETRNATSIWDTRIQVILEEYRFIYEALTGNNIEADKINPLILKYAKQGERFSGRKLTRDTIEAYKNIFLKNDSYKENYGKDNFRRIAYNIARINLNLIHSSEHDNFYNSFKQFKHKHKLNNINDFENYLKENGYYT